VSGVRERFDRVEALVAALEDCPDPAAREAARGLVRALLDLHAAGLERVLALAAGANLTDRLADDAIVGALLLLHGLHPHPAERRVGRALDRARSRFRTLGGDVELISAADDAVRLRLRGDPAAGPDMRAVAEEVVAEVVPDLPSLTFEEAWDPACAGRVPLPLAGARR
jgi:hypothetical protein